MLKTLLKKINLEQLKESGESRKKWLVNTVIYGMDSEDDSQKDLVKNSLDMDTYGYHVSKLFHIKHGIRVNKIFLTNRFTGLLLPKEITNSNPLIQPTTEGSVLDKVNHKHIKKGNRDFIKGGFTLLVRVYSGHGDYTLDPNIDFINDTLMSINGVSSLYNIVKIKTDTNPKGGIKKYLKSEYAKSREEGKNLIVLYGEKLDTGIDLKDINPDVMINLSKIGSTDIGVQILGRGQRANPKVNKKYFFFFDFDITPILKSIYENKKLVKNQSVNEFIYEYKDSIFNISDFKFLECDENMIKKLSYEINQILTNENVLESIYTKIVSNKTFNNIDVNSGKQNIFKVEKNGELGGPPKIIIDKVSKEGVEKSDEIRENELEIRQKLKFSDILREVIKIYYDMNENDCKKINDIIEYIIGNPDYYEQFKHNMNKVFSKKKCVINVDTEDVYLFILSEIYNSDKDDTLCYKKIIEPINNEKVGSLEFLFD